MKTFKRLVSFILVFSMIASMFLTITADTGTERTGISIDRVTTQNKFGEDATYPEGYYVTDKRLDRAPVTFEFWAYVPESVWSTASGVVLSTYAEIGASTNTNDWFTLSIEPEGCPKLSIGYSDGRCYEKLFGNWLGADMWTHVSIVLNDETNKVLLYVNGVYRGEADFGAGDSAPILNQNLNTLLYLLSDAHVANGKAMCDIKISDVAVYSDMRTDAEVSSDYVNGVNAGDDDLMLYYQISEDDKEKDIVDASGNGYDMKYNRTFITEAEMDAIRAQEGKDYAYSIVLLPDTHFYTTVAAQKRKAILDYVIANKTSKNIQYVIGLGDMSGDGKTGEWELVKEEYGRLDAAGIPYTAIRGNHDSVSNPAIFNSIFGQGTAYYEHVSKNGGFYKTDSSTNTYVCFKANNNVDYMILNLDFGIDRDVLKWADKVLSEHPNHRVIVSTHAWLSGDGRMLTVGSAAEPSMYNPAFLDPDYIWDKCLSRHANIDMIVCGHTQSDQILTTPIVGVNGNVVYQVLINNQNSPWQLSGLGNIAIMNFTADGSFANIAYYATVHDKYFYEGNADIKFDFDAKDAVPERTGIEFEEVTTSGVSHPDGYYKTEDKLGALPVTYEAWVNVEDFDAFKTGGSILGNREKGKNSYFTLELLPWGQISLKYVNEGTQKTYTFPIEADASRPTVNPVRIWNNGWHHLSIVHDVANDKIKCYVDGVFASEMSADGFALPALSNMSSTLYLGSDGEDGHSKFGASGAFAGVISNVALYSDVRTDTEIKNDYERGVSAGDADLIAAYDISSVDQNRNIADVSENGVDLKWYSSNIVMDGAKESYSTVKGLDSIPQTYEMWIYLPAALLSDLKSDVIFGNCNTANNNGIRIDIKENANGEIRLSYLGDWAQAVSWGAGATIPADTWTHVAITHDIATREVKFYFNGVLGATRDLGFTPDPAKVLANTTFYLGADGHDRSSLREPRVLGDFAAYSDVRTADEIAASYKNGIDVNDANLMLYWDIPETGKGQDIEDKSGNKLDLEYNSLFVLDRAKESYSTSKGFDVVPQTYEMWAYLPAESNRTLNNIIFSNVTLHNPNGIRIDFQENKDGYVRLAYLNDWTGATAWETGATVPVNTWVHVTIVHDLAAEKVYFYFNGELKATRENVAAPDANKVLANTEFYFGGDARDPAHSAPTRVLGDFAVYSDVRTAAEVMSDYRNGPDVNDANIMLYWDVPESNEKNNIVDKTGNGYDLRYSLVETPETEDKTYLLQDITDSIKLHGRTSVTSDGIVCDHSATGIEFSAYIEGEVKLSASVFTPLSGAQPDTYFTVYVDGVRQATRFNIKEGTAELVIANFEEGGVHTIRVLKQTESANSLCVMRSISFNGYLEKAPAEKDLFIEFLGDSITSGYGNLCANGTANAGNGLNQDATLTYAYLTAEKLGADHSLISCSGIGVAGSWSGNFVMKDFFTAQSYFRDTSVKYEKTFTPDIVVINLGTNDSTKVPDGFQFKEAAKELIALVRSTYGEDVKIVWAANMMGSCMETYSQAAINELGGAAAGLYFCSLTADWSGGGSHPSKEAHAAAATDLANFIREKVLPEIPDSYETCVDGEGNPLNPYFVNGDIWVEKDGKLKMPTGIVNSYLLFDNELATNRIEATFHMNLCWSNANRTGLAFALTDHDGDHAFDEGSADVSYYRAFICGQNKLGLVKMGRGQDWGAWLANEVELEPLGIDVSEGVTIAAEWDAEGNIRVYANGILAIEVKDETPLTGNLYGMVIREWCNTTGSYTDYVSSFKAVGALPIPDKKVEVTADPTEGGAVTGAGSYEHGTNVTLTAKANTGYTFAGWYIGETLVSTYKTYTFAVTEDVNFTAKFEKAEYTVPVDAQGNKLNPYFVNGNTWTEENGTMKPAPGAMENFILFDNSLNANRIEATFRNLPLNNDNNTRHGIVFALTDIDGDKTFGMESADVSYYFACVSGYGQIQLIKMGAGKSWSVYITGGSVDVASDVTLAVEWDAEGNIKVFANGNLVIDQNVGESLTGNLYGLLMRSWANTADGGFAHEALTTSFVAGSTVEAPDTDVNVTVNAAEGGTVNGAGSYDEGASVTVTATANAGYKFAGWYVGEELKSADAAYTFTAEADITLTAKFEKLQSAVEVTVTDTDINYTVNGNVVTVDYTLACKVGYLDGDKYVAITATPNGDGTYSFTVPEGITSVVVVVSGDVNGDGTVNAGDYGRLNALLQGKITLTAEQDFAANTNGDATVNAGDYGRLNAVLQGKTDLTW